MKKNSEKISNSSFYFLTIFIIVCYLFFSIMWFLTISNTNKWLFYLNNTSIVLTWLTIIWFIFNQYYLIPKKIGMLKNFKYYVVSMFEMQKPKINNHLNDDNFIKSQNFICFFITWFFILLSFIITGFNYGFYPIHSFLTIFTWIIFGSILFNGIFFFLKLLKNKKEFKI